MLATQLYFKGALYLAPNDACGRVCRSEDPGLIIELNRDTRKGERWLSGAFDSVLRPIRT